MSLLTSFPAVADARPDSPQMFCAAQTRVGHPTPTMTMPSPMNLWLGGVDGIDCESAQFIGTYAAKRINPGRLGGST